MKLGHFILFVLMVVRLNSQSIHIISNQNFTDLVADEVIRNGGNDSLFLSLKNIPVTYAMSSLINGRDLQNTVNNNNKSKFISDYFEYYKPLRVSKEAQLLYIDSTNTFYTLEETSYANSQYEIEESKPLLRYFYKNRAHFLQYNSEDFKISIDPIVNLRYGKDSENDNILFQNTRGVKIRGLIDNKVYFYTSIYENQAKFNNYVDSYIAKFAVIPSNGTYKSYDSSVIENLNGVDFHNAQAFVGVPISKHIAIEFGHGRHKIGNGYRSMLLSDFAQNYFYLRLNTQVWKFHYQNIFAELNPISARLNPGDNLLPKKYMASHYLAYKPHKRFEIGLYESVVFDRVDHFEFNYLNPIILYRSVEQFLDSPDNVLIGINASWIPLNRVQVYGQFLLDEFKFNELKSDRGWWANKYAIQIGAKVVEPFGIKNLVIQAEYNTATPYTYTHHRPLAIDSTYSTASYTNQGQSLAHPLGANFKEIMALVRFQPISRLSMQFKAFLIEQGEDAPGEFYGANINIPNTQRIMDYGNYTLQGIKAKTMLMEVNLSYEFFRNYYFDFDFIYRKKDSEMDSRDMLTNYIGGGIRINMDRYTFDF